MGLDPRALRKLQSFLVAAEAACSKGDFPVVAVDTRLTAVEGSAIAAVAAAEPTELAAAVEELLRAIKGAAQPLSKSKANAMRTKGGAERQLEQVCWLDLKTQSANYWRLQTTLKTPALQPPFSTGSNLLSGVLLSVTTSPVPLGPENSLYSIGR
jgi:hypothetical protein